MSTVNVRDLNNALRIDVYNRCVCDIGVPCMTHDAIAQALADERERAAKIAERCLDVYLTQWHGAGVKIAAAIRAGDAP